MPRRVQRAVGAFVFLTTCFVTPALAMESEYRTYEPGAKHGHRVAPALPAGVTPAPASRDDSRRAIGPAFRTGDGSHRPLAPHLSLDTRPNEFPKQDPGGAGLPVWRW